MTGAAASVPRASAPARETPRGPGPVRRLARGAALAAATVLAYLPALRAGFVFDDHVLVSESRLLQGPLSRIWLTTTSADYWPLTYSLFWAQWRLWGAEPWGYHAVTVLLHAATSILLWRVLRRLEVPGAWIAALLFALHPAAVESVAWISETKNTLSGALFLASILAWLRFHDRRAARPYALSLALFALACLAKASVVPLPLLLVGIVLVRGGRLARRDLAAVVPFFAVALATGLATLWFQRQNAMAGGWAPPRGLAQRIGESAWALATYQRDAYLPVRLGFVHEPWSVGPGSPLFWAPLLGIAAIVAALVALRRRSAAARAALRATGYHALMVLPVLGLLDIAYFAVGPVSNHLQYLALMGPAALAGAGVTALARRLAVEPAVIGVALAAALGVATFQRASQFEDDLTLWTAAVRAAPNSAYARNQLSGALEERGRTAEALDELLAAARVSADPVDGQRFLSQWLLLTGRPAEAATAAREILRASRSPEARRDAAWVLLQAGRREEALPVFRALVAEAPNAPDYVYWLAATLARLGEDVEAVEALRAWAGARPGEPQIERALAHLLGRMGRVEEARRHAAAALGVSPDDPRAAALVAAPDRSAGPRRR